MVSSWLPEPPNEVRCEDEIQSVDDIIIPGTDTSDTEDDDSAYNGYEPLPLGPVENENEESSEDDSETQMEPTPSTSEVQSVPHIIPIERTLIREVWSNPAPQCVDIEMDSDKANEVKMAMANFTLPSTSFPEWAANIPEDQWKEQLINRIQHLQENRKVENRK